MYTKQEDKLTCTVSDLAGKNTNKHSNKHKKT